MGITKYITLMYPEAFLIGLLLLYLYFKHLKRKSIFRFLMLFCAILLLCRPVIVHRTKALDLCIIADRSRSISDEARKSQMEIIDLAARNLEPGDRLGIISFNEKSYIEQILESEAGIKSFSIASSENSSDITEGLNTALSLLSQKRNSRMLLLSDGEFTGQSPVRSAQIARQMKIPVYYRNLKKASFFNLSIRDVDIPEKVIANEPFRVKFNISSTENTSGRYRIIRDGKITGEEKNGGWNSFNFKAGQNQIRFNDILRTPHIYSYGIEVETTPHEKEKIKSDNTAEKFIKVVGERPILIVNNTGQVDNLSRILSAGGLSSHLLHIENFRLNLNKMEGYKGIILNNVPILGLTRKQISDLRNFVVEEGGGLLVCGGNRSFASGGFYKTSLEQILPVSLEDRNQSKKISTAFSITMDRSGSMQMRTPSGKTKMSLANTAAVECLNLLTGADSISVIAVDSMAHIIVPQQPVDNPGAISSRILKIESMGGGIFTYTALVAAGNEIIKANQLNKHIILFADAADSEEPGKYKELLSDFEKGGITVSVIGLGTENDPDAGFLKDVAKRGNGEVYFTQDANQLIQFFTADTITYSRNSFIEEAAPMKIKGAAYSISPDQDWKDFSCSGYNLMFTKPKADVAIITTDEDNAPILAFWQRGVGRVASLALDTNGTFSGSSNYGDIILNTTRWIMGSNVFDNLQIKTVYEGNYASIKMEVSGEEREKMGAAKLTVITPSGKKIKKTLNWDTYNKLSSSIKMEECGCYRGLIHVGDKVYKTGPMSLPVSPEFLHDRKAGSGKRTLEQIASISGGKEILDVRDLFIRDMKSSVTSPVILPFLIGLIFLFLLDMCDIRFGILIWLKRKYIELKSRIKERRTQAIRTKKSTGKEKKVSKEKVKKISPDHEVEEIKSPEPEEEISQESDMDYLSTSKEAVKRRFRKKRED
jgi:VWA domain-containing protein